MLDAAKGPMIKAKSLPAKKPEDQLFASAPPAAQDLLKQHKAMRRQRRRQEFVSRLEATNLSAPMGYAR